MSTKKRKKINWAAVLSGLFIFAGIAIFFYPIVGNWYANIDRGKAITNYERQLEQMDPKEKAHELAQAQAYNRYLWGQQSGQPATPVAYKDTIKSSVMGYLDIPAIHMTKMPFYQGTTFAVLDKGLGHMQTTSIPVGGKNTRAVITGHSGIENQTLFSDAEKLKKSDVFYVSVLGQKRAYRIDNLKVVTPDRIDAIKIEANRDLVTLLTCTPIGINSHRLLVTGHRISLAEAAKDPVVARDTWSYQNKVLLISALVLMSLFLYLIVKHRKRAKL
ncbi:class C sortase [Lacticaseibacillus brantae]|uniref:SrtC protein n=1 Tax=Lacticaseibacillus brantae DSM 23927 TaxID=1423727 RepID=A0A0R2AWF5_9LACO|nr:class C sortase [Lacticaseibacillus brantae]KRM71736.1 srtC protein [Lacticaseibacillus brantae DSM 23927]